MEQPDYGLNDRGVFTNPEIKIAEKTARVKLAFHHGRWFWGYAVEYSAHSGHGGIASGAAVHRNSEATREEAIRKATIYIAQYLSEIHADWADRNRYKSVRALSQFPKLQKLHHSLQNQGGQLALF